MPMSREETLPCTIHGLSCSECETRETTSLVLLDLDSMFMNGYRLMWCAKGHITVLEDPDTESQTGARLIHTVE